MKNTVELFYVEFVLNNLGIWDRAWFLTEQEAHDEFERLKSEEGCSTRKECGEYGSLQGPLSVIVELTPRGLLDFAERHAVDQGA